MNPSDLLKMNYPPSILIYGINGCGKTALVSQLAGAYCFDFDGGMKTAATLKDKFFNDRQKVEFDIYKDPNPMRPVKYHKAVQKLQTIVEACGERTWKHTACIVDSLTGLCKAAQLHVQFLAQQDSFAKMEIQNWRDLVGAVNKFLFMLGSLRVPVIATAHVDYLETKKVGPKALIGEKEITDMFPSSATTKHGLRHVMSFFDEVWYAQCKIPKRKYTVSGQQTGIVRAQTRSSFGVVDHTEIGMVNNAK